MRLVDFGVISEMSHYTRQDFLKSKDLNFMKPLETKFTDKQTVWIKTPWIVFKSISSVRKKNFGYVKG